jgi:hypothetical protein
MKAIKYLFLGLIVFGASAYTNQTDQHAALRYSANQAFTYGEELNYRVHYGFINAASIKIKVADKPADIKGRSTYNIEAKGRTYSSFDWAYRVRDHFETYLDSQSIAPLKYFKSVEEDKYKDVDLVYYDHEKKYMVGKKKSMAMPSYVQDIVSGMFYARTIDFNSAYVGQTFPIDIYLDQKIYNLKFKYVGKEVIRTDVGKVRCIKLQPQLVVDRVFKDEDDMTIWVSDDLNKVPIRVQADIYVGSLKVDLTSYKGLRNSFSSKQ